MKDIKINSPHLDLQVHFHKVHFIVHKGYQPPPPPPPDLPTPSHPPPPPPPTLPTNQSSQVFLIDRNPTVKLSSMNTIHVKQQHNVDFQFHSKIHAKCLY